MSSLKDLITEALTSTKSDAALARALVDSGALAEIIQHGTYSEETVRTRLNYASPAALRAVLSKARRKKSSLPIPVTEGRRWGQTAIEAYQRRQRPPETASDTSSTSATDDSSTRSNKENTSGTSSSSVGILGSGTGGHPSGGNHRQDPDQWRNE